MFYSYDLFCIRKVFYEDWFYFVDNINIFAYNNKVLVPFFKINSQTLVDGSDIGNTIFQISDEFKYYNSKTIIIPNHK